MRRRVVITGMGCITPLGHTVAEMWGNVLRGASGASATELFDARTFPSTFSSQVKRFKLTDHVADHGVHRHAGRNTQFALAAAEQAWRQSGLDKHAPDPRRVGVYLGSGEGSLDFANFVSVMVESWSTTEDKLDTVRWAELAFERMDAMREMEQEPNMPASHVALRYNARGPNFNCLTACAASTQANGEAASAIRRGDVDLMISGGCHSMIHPFGVTGFNRLTALSQRNDSPATASRPFDQTRDGFVLGEGSSILILEEYEHARARGASMFAEIIGYGSSADAYRITDIHPEGRGGAAAMQYAIDDAGIAKADVDYICAHGTSTKENDRTETQAVKTVFGELAAKIPVSSPKSMLGHLIAAAGTTELICCVMAIRDGILPPTLNLNTPDPECDLDYVPNKPRKANVRTCMNNSFGFGGQNDCVIVRKMG
ncbi:MAG: beta-ketoacyl-[acyl-carrier-protein] synthase family protein [Phycisphaerae bacterium]|nr:beta-ketoacyl-[acyl-carrier-protein] synthase family protein [Phycisphaerae bacterium]